MRWGALLCCSPRQGITRLTSLVVQPSLLVFSYSRFDCHLFGLMYFDRDATFPFQWPHGGSTGLLRCLLSIQSSTSFQSLTRYFFLGDFFACSRILTSSTKSRLLRPCWIGCLVLFYWKGYLNDTSDRRKKDTCLRCFSCFVRKLFFVPYFERIYGLAGQLGYSCSFAHSWITPCRSTESWCFKCLHWQSSW